MLLAVYSFALFLALLLGLPYWLFRMLASGKYREGLRERLGRVPGRLRVKNAQPAIWIHAVSVGEVVAAGRLIEELAAQAPQFRIVVSTTTRAGQKLARERYGPDRAFYFPLDFAWIVRRYIRELKPVLLILVESEFWPNVLAEFRRTRIPAAVVNGRVSDRSLPRYLALRGLWKRIFWGVTLILAQSREDGKRFKAIGVPADRVAVTGNLKFDVRAAGSSKIAAALRAHLPKGIRVLVCGSTMEGEEEILIQAFAEIRKTTPALVMIVAPRHPERFDRVEVLMRSHGQKCVRRSAWFEDPTDIEVGTIVLLDSIGELAGVYSLASVAFVGKSLLEPGGHNPLEPAQFGVPIVTGPHYENFREIVDRLLDSEAIKLVSEETLVAVLSALLLDQEGTDALGLRALEVFESEAGATRRTVEQLLRLLPQGPPAESAERSTRQ